MTIKLKRIDDIKQLKPITVHYIQVDKTTDSLSCFLSKRKTRALLVYETLQSKYNFLKVASHNNLNSNMKSICLKCAVKFMSDG